MKKLMRVISVVAVGTAMALSAQSGATAHESRPDTGSGANSGAGTSSGKYEECRGVTVDKSAPVISRASVLIKAPVSKIWRLHTDIGNWASWIPEITPAQKKTPGPLRPGSVFEWSPQNMKVTSTVATVKPMRCIAWGGPVNGIDGVHLWTFKPVKGGVVATTEESWAGPPVEADIPGNQAALDAGLKDWVNRLKDAAEKKPECDDHHRGH